MANRAVREVVWIGNRGQPELEVSSESEHNHPLCTLLREGHTHCTDSGCAAVLCCVCVCRRREQRGEEWGESHAEGG